MIVIFQKENLDLMQKKFFFVKKKKVLKHFLNLLICYFFLPGAYIGFCQRGVIGFYGGVNRRPQKN